MWQVDIAAQVGRFQAVVFRCLRKDESKWGNCGQKNITIVEDDRSLSKIIKNGRSASNGLEVTWTGIWNSGPELCFYTSRSFVSLDNQGNGMWWRLGEQNRLNCVKQSAKFPQSMISVSADVFSWLVLSKLNFSFRNRNRNRKVTEKLFKNNTIHGVGFICFPRSTVSVTVFQKVLENFFVSSTEKFFSDEEYFLASSCSISVQNSQKREWMVMRSEFNLGLPTLRILTSLRIFGEL